MSDPVQSFSLDCPHLSCVVNIEHKNILSAQSGQIVHHKSNLLLLNHGADSNPALLIESCRSHTNEIDDTLSNTESTSSLDTATQFYNLGAHLTGRQLAVGILTLLELEEVVGSKVNKASPNGLANKILGGLVLALLGNLNLELAASKAQPHDHVRASNLVLSGSGNIGSWEENESNWEVLYESDIEAVLAAELDVGALEEVECSSIESTLCKDVSMMVTFQTEDGLRDWREFHIN
ncbi:hypothetical protein HG531_013906 [Fusarium graminearum]|nr:hypothetical protein HG531_013906 [Fusarium graminearum]